MNSGMGQSAGKAALLASVAVAALAVGMGRPVQAQSVSAPQISQNETVSFAIPAQPLAAALDRYAEATGMSFAYRTGDMTSLSSPGVSGTMTTREALQRLLAGTGVTFEFTGAKTVSLARTATDSTLQVPAASVEGQRVPEQATIGNLMPEYAGGQIARGGQVGMLGNKDVMDTPFSQTNYTNKTIQNQQARTVQDILSNDPSIITKQNGPSDEDGSISIRGFSNPLWAGTGSLNGLVGMAPMRTPDMDYMERVEVMRGPSALLNGMAAFGQGGQGGSYNLVTKQATDEPITQLTGRYGSELQLGAHADVGRRFGAEKQFGVRANVAYREGETSVEPVDAEVGLAAINLDYRGERVRLAVDLARQTSDSSPQTVQQLVVSGVGGAPAIAFVPEAPDASTSLFPTWSKQPSELTVAMLRGEVDITDTITAYGAIGKQVLDLSLIGPNQPRLIGTDGSYGWANVENTNLSYEVFSMQGGLRAKAETGPVSHALSFNASHSEMEQGEAQRTTPFTYTSNIYNPVFGGPVSAADPGDPRKLTVSAVTSTGIADTLSILDERIQVTGGIRYQKTESTSYSSATGNYTSAYHADAWTPAVGVIVKPLENVSLYTNYIENLQRGQIVGTNFSNAGEIIPPYVSKQYETGVKVDWGTITTTLAAFQIAQPNLITVTGTPQNSQKVDGEVRSRGLELNSYGEITSDIRFMGGLTYIDSEQTKTQGGLTDGYREAGVPVFRAVVGGEWDMPFLKELTLTGRVTYTGDQMVSSSSNTLKIPDWTVLDLGARYLVASPWNNKPITLRFNVDNVLDKDYWSGSNYRYVQLGAPRTFWLSATVDF